MDFHDTATAIAAELIRKSGVREYDDTEQAERIAATAGLMSAIIHGEELMPNAVYFKTGTPIIFGSEVADDVAWSTESIATAAGRQSAFHDQGADGTARQAYWRYRFYAQFQATPTVGNVCRLILKTSDGTHPDNDDGTGDAAVSSINKLSNLWDLRPIVCDEAAANIEMVSTGVIEIHPRHFGVVLWNTTGATITADAAETKAVFTPYYAEIQ